MSLSKFPISNLFKLIVSFFFSVLDDKLIVKLYNHCDDYVSLNEMMVINNLAYTKSNIFKLVQTERMLSLDLDNEIYESD